MFIDFIKALIHNPNRDLIFNGRHEVQTELNESTGEIKWRCIEYKGIKLYEYSSSGAILLRGSLHYFFNNGKHNYNNFGFKDLLKVLEEIKNEFGITPGMMEIQNIEFGINLSLSVNVNRILDGLLMHQKREFETLLDSDGYYKQVKHSNYYVKCYHKGKQFNQGEILRFELKIKKKAFFKQNNISGINTLQDLLNSQVYDKVKEIVIYKWNEIVFYDFTINPKTLNIIQLSKSSKYSNVEYWRNVINEYRNKYSSEIKNLKQFNEKHGQNVQLIIAQEIEKKWCNLTKDLKEFENQKVVQSHQEFISDSYVENSAISHLEYSVNLPSYSDSSLRVKICPITGINISNQKGGKFVSAKTILELYSYNYDLYIKLENQYLSINKKDLPLEKKCYYIAHNIRNVDCNRRNNTKRAIENIINPPTLFDCIPFIDKEKLKWANYLK